MKILMWTNVFLALVLALMHDSWFIVNLGAALICYMTLPGNTEE